MNGLYVYQEAPHRSRELFIITPLGTVSQGQQE